MPAPSFYKVPHNFSSLLFEDVILYIQILVFIDKTSGNKTYGEYSGE
jgi:hypothetical protein